MTSHAQRRRRKLAAKLGVTNRTAANIMKARTAAKREEAKRPPEELPAKEHKQSRERLLSAATDEGKSDG